MFFSIIIPILNEEDCLPIILDSLVNQTFKDFEVIVVDGGSTDDSLKIINRYQNAKIKIILHSSKKANVSIQRNIGARNAQGKYLYFFDADIKIDKNFLFVMKSQLEKNKFRLVTTHLSTVDSLFENFLLTIANLGRSLLIAVGNPIAGGYNICIEKDSFFQVNGFRESIYHGEDVDLLYRLKDAGISLHNLSQPKLEYSFRRIHQEGYLVSIWKMLYSIFYFLRHKGIEKHIFDYPMGGSVYKKEKKV